MRLISLQPPSSITKSKQDGRNRTNWTFWTFWNIGLQAIPEAFYVYFCYLYLSETKSFVLKTKLDFNIFLIWSEAAFGFTVSSILCFWFFFIWLLGVGDSLATADIFFRNSSKISPLWNVHQHIFLTLWSTLHSKSSRYTICNIDYRCDVSLCMRVHKEIKKKMMRKKKNVKQPERIKGSSLRCCCVFQVIILEKWWSVLYI